MCAQLNATVHVAVCLICVCECVCGEFVFVQLAGVSLWKCLSLFKKKKNRRNIKWFRWLGFRWQTVIWCFVVQVFLYRASARSWVTWTPQNLFDWWLKCWGVIVRCFYGIGSIFYVYVSRRAGMLRIYMHQYPRCMGTIKNISRCNLLYLCLVWLLSCIWNLVIRGANWLQSQRCSKWYNTSASSFGCSRWFITKNEGWSPSKLNITCL